MGKNKLIKDLKEMGVDYNTIRRFRYEMEQRKKYDIDNIISKQNEKYLGISFSMGSPTLKDLKKLASAKINISDYTKKLQQERAFLRKTGTTKDLYDSIKMTQKWLNDFTNRNDLIVTLDNFVKLYEIYERIKRYELNGMTGDAYESEINRAIEDLSKIFGELAR